MKLATFEVPTPAGPIRRIGALVDGRLIDLRTGYLAHLQHADPGCDAQHVAHMLFPLGHGDLSGAWHARRKKQHQRRSTPRSVSTRHAVHGPATPCPMCACSLHCHDRRVIRDFLTFEGHMRQASRALGRGGEIPQAWYEVPAYYKGDPDTVVGPDAEVIWPSYTQRLDFELELGMVIGRRGQGYRPRGCTKVYRWFHDLQRFQRPRSADARGPRRDGSKQGQGLRYRQRHRAVLGDAGRNRSGARPHGGEGQWGDLGRGHGWHDVLELCRSDRPRVAKRNDLPR
ncbi:MAG: hypothetical protein KatS3mg059_0669 [Thermomicrobiales bacterium]|nr:MAG: hypothetical protein KatS3mg059_0669 [Thermomicrobiales bacterium]